MEFDRYLEKQKLFIRNPGMQQERVQDLLRRIKAELPAMEAWLAKADDENGVYRFYHHSNKVFRLQNLTKAG